MLGQIIRDIRAQGQYVPRAVLLMLLFMAGYIWLLGGGGRERWKPLRLLTHWRTGLFVFYLAFLLVSTVFGRRISRPAYGIWDHMWFRNSVQWNSEIIENILFFIPYTILFLAAFRPARPFRAALLLSLCTSMGIELSQLICRLGEFQFSDILYNTVGGIAGWGISTLAGGWLGRGRGSGFRRRKRRR